jgi:hypothetical protein
VAIVIKLNSILIETLLVNVTFSFAGNNGYYHHLTFRYDAGGKRVAIQKL